MNSILRNLKILLVILALGGISNQAQATHAAGAEITYRCLGGDTFELTYKFYRDCGGVGAPTASQINRTTGNNNRTFISCTSGGSKTPSWTKTSVNDVTPICQTSKSECEAGGTVPGIEEHVFTDTLILNPQCNNWTIGVRVNARNASTNISAGQLYVETTIFSTNKRCNSSPTFTSQPAPYFCIGQKINYSYGAVDPDGDSLIFSFENPKTGPTTISSFRTGYSKLQPISGITINYRNGDLAFTGPTSGTFTLTILISKYDKTNGKLLGTVMRDIQVASTNLGCASNSAPTTSIGGMANVTNGARKDSLTVITKAGSSLCFEMPFSDSNIGDTITTSTNAITALPGTVTTSQIGVNPANRRVCWTVPTATTGIFNLTFEAKDNNCPLNASASLTAKVEIGTDLTSAVISGVKETCFKESDGSLLVTHQGGIGPFGYLWDSAGVRVSAITKTVINIPSNISYAVTVVDSFDMKTLKSAGFNLAVTLPVSVAKDTITNIGCLGGCTGAVNISSVTGGNGAYNYKWSPSGDTISNPTGLCAGQQLVTISDDNGCDSVYSFSVDQIPKVGVSIIDSTNISCKGGSDGEAASIAVITSCGVYSSTTAKCATTSTVSIGAGASVNTFNGYPAPLGQVDNAKQQYLYLATELKAQGYEAGRISKIAFDKTTTSAFSSVKNYSVNIGCTDSSNLDSGFVGGLFEVFNASSFAFNPFITKVTISFGQEFVWDGNSNIVVQLCYDNESAGFPSNATVKYTTTSFNSVAYFASKTENACLKDSATVIIKNRPNLDILYCDAGISYSWNSSPVQTDSNATNLPAGQYIVTASTLGACSDKDTVTLTEPLLGLTLKTAIVDSLDCAGDTNGIASVSVVGGTPGFTFAWPAGVTTQAGADSIATNLSGGIKYKVTVTDSKGCEDTITILLTEPNDIFFNNFTIGDVSCKGGNDGSINVTASGGSGIFPASNYLWNPVQTGSSTNITGLTAGTYRLTVTDSKACPKDTLFTVGEPADTITFGNFTLQNVLCKGASTGAITVTPSGGSGVYTTYLWNPVQTGQTTTLTGLAANTYRLTVTDSKTCTGDTLFEITEPASGVNFGNSLVTDVNCFGDNSGQIIVIPSGGSGPPYTNYRWTANAGSTNDTAKNLLANTIYSVTVANGTCDYDTSWTLTEPVQALDASFSKKVLPTCTAAGSNELNVTGGSKPYTFIVVGANGQNTGIGDSVFTNIVSGVIEVLVRDAKGCEITKTDTLINSNSNIAVTFTLIDEPDCFGDSTGSVYATITGGAGIKTYTFIAKAGKKGTSDSIWIDTPSDTITVNVEDAGGCKASATTVLGQPDSMVINVQVTQPVSCATDSTGFVRSIVTGGTRGASPSYTYNWNGIGKNAVADSLRDSIPVGTFKLNIVDSKGCKDSVDYNMTGPINPLIATVIKDTVNCGRDTNGTAYVIPSGGTPGYTYNWNSGNGGINDDTSKFMRAGVFIVTITDKNNCELIKIDSIGSPDTLKASFSVVNNPGCGSSGGLGDVTVTPTGGTPNNSSPLYSYTWIGAGVGTSNDSIRTSLPPGTISVVVSDSKGCTSDTVSQLLTPPGNINPSFTLIQNPSCDGLSNGRLISTPTGGNSPYAFTWTHGTTGISDSDRTNLPSGVPIIVTIRDGGGCVSKDTITLTNPSKFRIQFTDSISVLCAGGTGGSVTTTPINGGAPFIFDWKAGVSTQTGKDSVAIGLSGSVVYYVKVTDDNLCNAFDTIILNEPAPLSLSFSDSIEVKCFNEPDGSLTITPSGGSGIYTYAWTASNGDPVTTLSTSDSIAIKLIGNVAYTVKVTDAVGLCSTSATYTLDQPTDLRAFVLARGSATCGDSNGTIRVRIFGGTQNQTPPAYSVVWDSNGTVIGTGQFINNLYSGLYNFTATDANGCFMQDTSSVNDRGAPRLFPTGGPNNGIVDATCNGVCDGEVNLTLLFSQAPVSYFWSNGDITQDADSLCAGQYNVVATDTNGCKAFYNFDIQNDTNIAASSSVTTPLSCNSSACDGVIKANGSKGIAPYKYVWNTSVNDTLDSISNRCAGTFIVSVTDSKGCLASDTSKLLVPTNFSVTLSADSANCNGSSDGSVRVSSITGGAAPYSYKWNTGSNDTLFAKTGLGAGSYIVEVFEDGGCSILDTIQVEEPDTIGVSFATVLADCGLSNGSVTATVTNGKAPYSFNWPNAGITTSNTDNGYPANSHNVLVSDSRVCTVNKTFTIGNRNGPIITVDSVNDESCVGACDGDIFTTVTGGNPIYVYDWLQGNGSSDDTLNLCPNTYTLKVTDQKNCLGFSVPITVDPAIPLIPNASVVSNATVRSVCDGIGISNPTGGSGSYGYKWLPSGDTTQTITGLCAGLHFLTVTDSVSGCIGLDTIEISEPQCTVLLSTTITKISNASAQSICDGSARVTVAGGVTPLTFRWTSLESIDIATALCGGMNYVTITDKNGCQAIDSVEIIEPVTIILTQIDTTAPKCGLCDGKIKITPAGGLIPYTYKWDNNDATDSTINRCAGIINVTVTDANLDSAVFQIGLSSQNAPTLAMLTNDVSCFGACNGNAAVVPTGGSAPYNYVWPSLGKTDSTIGPLCKGIYLVEVRDSKGCIAVDSANIKEPLDILVNVTTDSADCAQNNGAAAVTAVGGTGTLTFKWSNGAGNVTSISGLGAGAYTVEVSDANCVKSIGFDISNPAGPTVTLDTVINETCIGSCNGAIFITPSGIVPGAYRFDWTPSSLSGEDVSNLCSGIYSVKVTDAANCATVVTDTVKSPTNLGTIITVINNASSFGKCDGKARISIFKPGVYKYAWSSGDAGDTARMLCAGVNYVTITSANGCQYLDSVVINQPQKLILIQVDTDEPNCNVCNGKAFIAVTGGIPPFAYKWDNGDAADSTTKRCAGVLFVTVTDSRGYAEIFSLGLNNNLAPVVTTSSADTRCFDECSGTASAFASGTLAPYKYTWPSLGKTGATVSNLCSGFYIVEVVDNVGCVVTSSVTIGEASEIEVNVEKVLPSCGVADGIIFTNTKGGNTNTTGYSYSWLDGISSPIIPAQTTDRLISVSAGLFYIVVTDNFGCKDTTSITLDNTGGKIAIGLDSIQSVSCASECDGAIFTSISGTSPGTYEWLPGGQTTPNISSICSGIYTAVVTDTSKCKTLQSFTVNGPDPLNVVFSRTTDATCYNTNDGTITAFVASTEKIRIAWNGPGGFGSNKLKVENLLPGTYSISVTDESNCVTTDSISVDAKFRFLIQLDSNRTTCSGSIAEQLEVKVATDDFYSTFWYDGSGKLVGRQDTVSVLAEPGDNNYVVEVRQDVCIKTDTIIISQRGNLFADAGENVKMVDGQRIILGGSPSAPENAIILWTPSTGLSASNVQNPVSSVTKTTVYRLIVGDVESCFVTDSVVVTINDKIEINDGFSPNGDGVNDVWEIAVLKDFPDAKVTIFNRWGQTIYETDPYIPWDGTFEGQPTSIGTYYYIIDLKDTSVSESVLSGPVTIIR
jgi:gliding motility-associated-like protein